MAFLSDPSSESNVSRLGGWVCKNDPDRALASESLFKIMLLLFELVFF